MSEAGISIAVTCPNCGGGNHIRDRALDRQFVRCLRCGKGLGLFEELALKARGQTVTAPVSFGMG